MVHLSADLLPMPDMHMQDLHAALDAARCMWHVPRLGSKLFCSLPNPCPQPDSLVYNPTCDCTQSVLPFLNGHAYLNSDVPGALTTHSDCKAKEQHMHTCRALALGIHTEQATHWLKQAF